MKFNIAYPRTGAQKMYNIDDEHKWGKLVDRRMGNEFEGEILGDEFKGYMFKITGGTDNDGFPMKQGILVKGRVRLILEPGTHFSILLIDTAGYEQYILIFFGQKIFDLIWQFMSHNFGINFNTTFRIQLFRLQKGRCP